MRHLLAKIMVLCLLLITVHTASGGEHTPVHDTNAVMQSLSLTTLVSSPDDTPSDDEQINSECNICHAAHVLLLFTSEQNEAKINLSNHYDGKAHALLPSHIDDISHPPIILI